MTILAISVGVILYVLSIYFIGIPLAKASIKEMDDINNKRRDGREDTNFRNFFFFPMRTALSADLEAGTIFTGLIDFLANVHDAVTGEDIWFDHAESIYNISYAILWPIMFLFNILLLLIVVCIFIIITIFFICSAIVLFVFVVIPELVVLIVMKKVSAKLKA